MISDSKSTCPKCGGQLKYYDTVKRIVRTKYGVKNKVDIRSSRCQKCSAMHRELPDFIFPYKQYEAEIIIGVLEGFITCETLGFEDYPCEMTMIRWRNSQELQLLLWKTKSKGDSGCQKRKNTYKLRFVYSRICFYDVRILVKQNRFKSNWQEWEQNYKNYISREWSPNKGSFFFIVWRTIFKGMENG